MRTPPDRRPHPDHAADLVAAVREIACVLKESSRSRLDEIVALQRATVELLNQIITRVEIMAKATEEVRAFSAKIDAATSRIGAAQTTILERIQRLIDGQNTGLTDEAKATLQEDVDALETSATALEAIGKDPENPVPPGV